MTYLRWNKTYYGHQTCNENHVIITYDYLSQNIPVMNRIDKNKKKIKVLLNCLSLLVPLFEREDY
jgi:hypothetical protein